MESFDRTAQIWQVSPVAVRGGQVQVVSGTCQGDLASEDVPDEEDQAEDETEQGQVE